MEAQLKNWDSVIGKIADRVGDQFDPDKRAELGNSLAQILVRELPHLDRDAVRRALEQTLRDIRIKTVWPPFICYLLSLLPGWWIKLANNPGFDASTMLLLTDGRVMCQEQGGLRWKALKPDASGSYINGTWSDLAPMHNTRRYYTSAVLSDGRVLVSGGEYSDAGGETNKTEIYNPATDTWTQLSPPSGWSRVGDAACAVLPDGRLLMGNLDDTRTAIFDPATDSWTAGPAKGSASSEESWVLLPDDTVVTVRCDSSRKADKYVAASNTWVDGGTLTTGIVEIASSEIGAAILMNDGRAWFAGANSHNAIHTMPAVASNPGAWSAGPDFPNDSMGQTVGCKDSPSCLMTNGKVLIAAGPVNGVRGDYLTPTYFFEFNGSSLRRVSDPPNATNVPYIGRMLLLPTGQILFAAQTNEIYAYNYFSCTDPTWRPHITSCPPLVRPWHSYTLYGSNLNGLSQAVGYGDDASAATNYPLVRIRHKATGKITYCKTFEHSTMGVATGTAIESTNFAVPFGIPAGASEIYVVANGIASSYRDIEVESFVIHWPLFDAETIAILFGSLADGPLWVLGPNGPIPVDPWGPKYRKEAKAAWEQISKGVKSLQKLGAEVNAKRKETASAAPLAPDDDTEEEDDDVKLKSAVGKKPLSRTQKSNLKQAR
jgi:hypothetical protein